MMVVGVVSGTVTEKLQEAVLPATSYTLHVTADEPRLRQLRITGEDASVVDTMPMLTVVSGLKDVVVNGTPTVAGMEMFAGQIMTSRVSSRMILSVQEAVSGTRSGAVRLTG